MNAVVLRESADEKRKRLVSMVCAAFDQGYAEALLTNNHGEVYRIGFMAAVKVMGQILELEQIAEEFAARSRGGDKKES